MRMSTVTIQHQQRSDILDNQSKLMRIQQQLSSGKRVSAPSDDPLAASQAVLLSQSMAEKEQYVLARTFAQQNMAMEETVLRSSADTIKDIKAVLVNASNGTLSDDDRESLALQLDGLREQLLGQANAVDGNGRYIFAGYANDKPPFVEKDGEITYVGGSTPITQNVEASREMIIAHTGDSVFMKLPGNPTPEPDGGTSEPNVFKNIDNAIAALRTPLEGESDESREEVQALLDKSSRGLDNAFNTVLGTSATMGTQLQELDVLNSMSDEVGIINSDKMSKLVDVDQIETISAYYVQQAALEASYKTFSNMQGMSLFQMMR